MRHGAPAMTALSQATREAVRGPRGVRHPFSWAAYGILLGELPSENARMARVEQSASESLSPAASRAPAGLDSRAAIRVRP
jgi:hypothetical protein